VQLEGCLSSKFFVTQWDLTPNDFLGGVNFDLGDFLGGAEDPKPPPPPLVAPMSLVHYNFILTKQEIVFKIH